MTFAAALWAGVRRRPLGAAALAWLVVVVTASVAAPLIAPYGPNAQDLIHVLSGPSARHWLGTGVLGRDVLSRLLYGGRVTLLGVVVSDALFLSVGLSLGLAAGYLGGWTERAVLRLADVVYSVPLVVVLLVVVAIFPGDELVAMVGLGLLGAPGLARVVRSRARALRHEPYVRAATAAGLGPVSIMRRHILPQITGTVVVQLSLFSAAAVLLETGLGFLGVGATGATWGGLVSEASQNLGTQPWLLVPSGFLIITFILSLGLVGDAARDALVGRYGGAGSPSPTTPRRTGDVASTNVTHPNPGHPITGQPDVGDRTGAIDRDGSDATGHVPSPAHGRWSHHPDALLSVRGLTVTFPGVTGPTPVVSGIDLDVMPGESVGIVGESGCGKTVTARALLRLLAPGGCIAGGSVRFGGLDLLGATPAQMRQVRGARIGWVPQEPVTSLDPCASVGSQLVEAVRIHEGCRRKVAQARALDLLGRVGLPRPADVARLHPHQLSGGMAQRVGIAAALAGEPVLLVADEPTSALDVTVQSGILDLLGDLQGAGMALLLVTHDWGVLADLCQRAVVMYAGQVVEHADTRALFQAPRHPYTAALLAADPHNSEPRAPLAAIDGSVPQPADWPAGCRFQGRCTLARPQCGTGAIPLVAVGEAHESRCCRSELLADGTQLLPGPGLDPGLGAPSSPSVHAGSASLGSRRR
jgi:peptide/nickel transport system permease protein